MRLFTRKCCPAVVVLHLYCDQNLVQRAFIKLGHHLVRSQRKEDTPQQ